MNREKRGKYMITITDNRRNRVTMYVRNDEVGHLDYKKTDDILTAHSVEVYPEFNGRGYAKFLVQSFVSLTELNGFKAGAKCPYAVNYFDKNGLKNFAPTEE